MDLQQLFADVWPLVPTYAHLLVSAIFPIYVGAHASLSRPASAGKPTKKSGADKSLDEDEDEDQIQRMEGLSPSDAILFPIMAGCTLAGLYFLIKWLQDPAMLNKILNAYFGVSGALSVAQLLADAMGLLENFVFPNVWVRHGVVWRVNSTQRTVKAVQTDAAKRDHVKTSPLPGIFSDLTLPKYAERALWRVRELPYHKWTIQLYIQHIAAGKTHVGINGGLAIVLSLLVTMYYNLVGKPWFLTNLLGISFSYSALQLLSPTTFTTGTLILSALFFYDIYFVFYTPMMVTVAKSLDVPIKLLFPRPAAPGESPETAARSHAMLGLGDVVLPGIMIGLALRYDLYMHYVRKQKTSRTMSGDTSAAAKLNETDSKQPGGTEIEKAPYVTVSGRYGDVFWTHGWFGQSLLPKSSLNANSEAGSKSPGHADTSFPKPFFYASVAGYLLGLVVTLSVMHIWSHAQPALLYLVPGVLLSLLATGAVRGELMSMWNYTEEEVEESPVPTDEAAKKPEHSDDGADKSGATAGPASKGDRKDKQETRGETVKVGHYEEEAVFKLSVSKKPFGPRMESKITSSGNKTDEKGQKLD